MKDHFVKINKHNDQNCNDFELQKVKQCELYRIWIYKTRYFIENSDIKHFDMDISNINENISFKWRLERKKAKKITSEFENQTRNEHSLKKKIKK